MTGIEIAAMIVLLVLGVFLVVSMLMQKGSTELSGTIAGGSRQTYYGKDRESGKARAGRILTTLTVIASIAFVVIVLLVYIIQPSIQDGLATGDEWHNLSEFYSGMNK
ncbi:MAG: preprotein translocase subunit SecG [Eubacteriales bacterium]